MNNKIDKILTIGIPTYNRCSNLKIMLPRLLNCIKKYKEKIDVIISDNYSNDGTYEFLNTFIKITDPSFSITVERNDTNIGVSKNIIKLFMISKTKYFIFLGDDDQIFPSALEKIIQILESKNSPSAIIQTKWEWYEYNKNIGFNNWKKAAPFFYEYGNAWSGVIDRSAALNAVISRGILNEIEVTVWPQTVMAYLAIYDLRNSNQIYLADFEIGGRIGQDVNLINMDYLNRSLLGLLTALSLVNQHTSGFKITKYFLSFKNHGFFTHLKAMFIYGISHSYEKNRSIANLLNRKEFGFRRHFFKLIFLLFNYPKTINTLAMFLYCGFKFSTPKNFKHKIEELRIADLNKEIELKKKSMRYDNWF